MIRGIEILGTEKVGRAMLGVVDLVVLGLVKLKIPARPPRGRISVCLKVGNDSGLLSYAYLEEQEQQPPTAQPRRQE